MLAEPISPTPESGHFLSRHGAKKLQQSCKKMCFWVHFWGHFLGPLLGPAFGNHFYGFLLKVIRICLIRGLKIGPFLGPFFWPWKRGWLDPMICISFKARKIPGCLSQARPWHQEQSKTAHPRMALVDGKRAIASGHVQPCPDKPRHPPRVSPLPSPPNRVHGRGPKSRSQLCF